MNAGLPACLGRAHARRAQCVGHARGCLRAVQIPAKYRVGECAMATGADMMAALGTATGSEQSALSRDGKDAPAGSLGCESAKKPHQVL